MVINGKVYDLTEVSLVVEGLGGIVGMEGGENRCLGKAKESLAIRVDDADMSMVLVI